MLTCSEVRKNAVENHSTAKAWTAQKEVLRRMEEHMRELDTLA